MKGLITTLTIMIISSLSVITAQRSYTYVDNGSYNRYQYRYNDNYDYRNDNRRDRFRSSYTRDNYIYSQMSQRDRKKLNKLERKFRETERCAWENGRLSRKEIRRLDNIRDDIDRLVRKYERRDRYNSRPNYNNRRGCP